MREVKVTRPYFDAQPDDDVATFAAEADRHPVFEPRGVLLEELRRTPPLDRGVAVAVRESPRSGGGGGGLDEIPQRACPTADDRVAVREQEVVGVELEQPAEGGEQPGLH